MSGLFDSRSGGGLRDAFSVVVVALSALVWPVPPVGAQTSDSAPTITPHGHIQAPLHAVPDAFGTTNYKGDFILAGDYVIERDPYDPVKATVSPALRVRRQSDHALLATLDAERGLHASSYNAVFSDGQVLALVVRPEGKDDRANRVEVRSLPDARLLYTLAFPQAKTGDDFGRAVWFTADRILVAAPGRTRYQKGDGVICVFDRADGRFIKAVSPGIRGARFGVPPDAGAVGMPYVQTYGSRALIVHGRQTFLLTDDRWRCRHPMGDFV